MKRWKRVSNISEQTLSFVPKLIALGVCLVVFGSAAVELLTKFTGELFARDRSEDAMIAAPDTGDDVDLVALDDALVALGQLDPRKAQIVEMRFFGGLTVEEIGDALSLSAGTIKRDWRAAKAWLYHELTRESGDGRGTLGAD